MTAWALLLAPLAWLALRIADRSRLRRLRGIAGPRLEVLVPRFDPRRRAFRTLLGCTGLLMGTAAVLDPARGEGSAAGEVRGADLVVCLDVSRSMTARDIPPSRLARARSEIASLAARARGDRLALVAFAGEARLLVPLTRDLESLVRIAETADPISVRTGGTDLGAALEAALRALDAGGAGRGERAILLLTDGEDLEGRGARAAALCRERGVAVHGIAFGTERGGKMALEGPAGGFRKDRAGREVVTRMDPASLRAVAAASDGSFADAGSAEHPVADLYESRILPRVRGAAGTREGRGPGSLLPWTLLAAFACGWVELCLTDRRRS